MGIVHKFNEIKKDTFYEIFIKYHLINKNEYAYGWAEFTPENKNDLFNIYMGCEMQYFSIKDEDLFIYKNELDKIVIEEYKNNKLPNIWKFGTILDLELNKNVFFIYKNRINYSFGVEDFEGRYLSNMFLYEERDPDLSYIEDPNIEFYWCYAEDLFNYYENN